VTDSLARIDRLIADHQRQLSALRDLRAVVASERRSKPDPELDDGDDFAPFNLVMLAVAAQRFEINKSTLQRWCREDGIGVLHGGRWRVSIPRLRRHMGQR
jgi:hypothetical protein